METEQAQTAQSGAEQAPTNQQQDTPQQRQGASRAMATPAESEARTLGIHSRVARAVDLIWNGNIPAAEELLAQDASRFPRSAITLAEAIIFRATLSGSKAGLERTFEVLNTAERLAEEFAKDHPARAIREGLLPAECTKQQSDAMLFDLEAVRADALFFSVGQHFRAGNRMKGIWRMRKAWSAYSALTRKLAPRRSEAGSAESAVFDVAAFGTGTFLFLLSMTPDMILKVLEIVGFEGNRELGLDYLRDSFYGGGVRSPISGVVLLLHLLVMPRVFEDGQQMLIEAESVIRVATSRWPNSVAFLWLSSFFERKHGDLAAALVLSDRAILANGANDSTSLLFDRSGLLLSSLRFEDAVIALRPLSQDPSNDNYSTVMLLLSACHKVCGRHREAKEILDMIPTSSENQREKNISEAIKRCRKRSSGAALIPFEWMAFRREFATMSQEHARHLLDVLNTIWLPLAEGASKEEVTLHSFVHSLAVGATGDRVEMIKELNQVVVAAKEMKREPHIAPFAEFELAEILFRTGDVSGAETLLKSCSSHSDYIFEDWIKGLARSALAQITKTKKHSTS